jgi:hypothetical protein
MITSAGIYDIPFSQYLGKALTPTPPLSASTIKAMLDKSPWHAACAHPDIGGIDKEDEETTVSGIGTVAHALILKQADKRIAVSPYPEFRTNEAKAWRDSNLAAGKVVVKEENFQAAVRMAAAFEPQMSEFAKELGEEFTTDQVEKTVVVQINGVWCKIRIDAICKSLWDIKSTGADYTPAKWIKNQLYGLGMDISVAFYKRVWKALAQEDKRFILAVIEQSEPHDAYPVILGEIGLDLANEKIDWAFDTWKRGIETGKWDGYSRGRVIYAYPPAWELTQWEEFKEHEKQRAETLQREAA